MRTLSRSLAVGCLLLARGACAEWSIQPSLSNFSRVNDNRTLEARPETRYQNVTDVSTPFEFVTPDYTLNGRPSVRVSRFTGSRMLDSDDVMFNLKGQRQRDYGFYGVEFGYERASTLTTELLDSGIVDKNIFRTSFNVSPYWARQLNERTLLRLTGGISDVSFDQQDNNNNFSAFSQYSVGPEVTYDLTARFQLFTSANVSRFQLAESGDTTDSLALQGGTIFTYSPTLQGRAIFGWNFSTVALSTPVLRVVNGKLVLEKEAYSDGDLVTFDMEKTWSERIRSHVSWTRRFSPSSQGSRQFREEIQGGTTYQLFERTSISTGVMYSDQTQESELIRNGTFGINQIAVDCSIRHKLTADFSIEAGYRRLMKGNSSNDNSVSSNEIFVGLSYNGNSLRYP